MSVHQINELISKNLAMNFYGFAKSLVEKINVKDLKFNHVFKEWATHLVMNKFMHLAPWEVLEPVMMSLDGKSTSALKALHDYISLLLTNNIDIKHFLNLTESFFKFCDMKCHLMVLKYIISKNEWNHFQKYLQKLDENKL